jgi:osmotically-inducible protein OsmY
LVIAETKLYHFATMTRLATLLALAALALGAAGCFPHQLSEAELSDPGIKARLEDRLQAQPNLHLRYVTLDVHQRAVTISGIVPTYEERYEIERIAKRLPGVDQVLVNLVVQE